MVFLSFDIVLVVFYNLCDVYVLVPVCELWSYVMCTYVFVSMSVGYLVAYTLLTLLAHYVLSMNLSSYASLTVY